MALINNTADHVIMATNLIGGGEVVLIPGVNDINDKAWGEVRGQFEQKLADKKLIEVGVKIAKDPLPLPKNVVDSTQPAQKVEESATFSKLAVKDANELVALTFDIELLKKWQGAETRDGVRATISARIEELEKGNKVEG